MDLDPTTTKYMITAKMAAEGVVEKPDVIGAIFGQTEGLLGEELDLRDLQKSGRIGRIEVSAESKGGKTSGEISMPSSLDKVETAILAAALESIDRIGPCKASVEVLSIDDVRKSKRGEVIDRAKQLLQQIADENKDSSGALIDEVQESVRIEELVSYGPERLPAGPNVSSSDSILVVEGRNDVANLLRNGIKNAIATEGTSIPETVKALSKEKVVTAFVDGDRGGELLLKELIQVAEVDFVAQAPPNHEVEEISQKLMTKVLRNKVPVDQYIEEAGLKKDGGSSDQQQQQQQQQQKRQRKQEQKKPERKGSQQEQQESKKDEGDDKGRSRSRDRGRERRRGKQEPRRSQRDKQESSEQEKSAQESKPSPRGDPLAAYRTQLDALSGDLKGVLMDASDNVVKGPVPVRDLADTLRNQGGDIKAVVFDGVITQRILDIAGEKKIEFLVGVKKGNITQEPSDVEVLTRDDL